MNKRLVIVQDGWSCLLTPTILLGFTGWLLCRNGYAVSGLFVFGLAVIILLFMAFFFRNPIRKSSEPEHHILAGADGTIRSVETIPSPNTLGVDALRISTYLSPLDVHVNRAPIQGQVTELSYTPGQHLLTRNNLASEYNEHSTIRIENEQVFCVVRQIVGPVVRRVVYWLKLQQTVDRGEQIGMMKFGSRMDIYLPADKVTPVVKPGDKVQAGIHAIASLQNPV